MKGATFTPVERREGATAPKEPEKPARRTRAQKVQPKDDNAKPKE